VTRLGAALGTIVFFCLAPGIVAGVMPWWIGGGWRIPDPWPLLGIPAVAGAVLILSGLLVLIDSFVRFARSLGTPAPVAPTQHLVVDGWYRFVRNPMYVAVLAILLGQALLFWTWPVLAYGIVVFVAVHLFVTGYEEPTLKRQFPTDYGVFFANVPRWLPRPTPWRGA
jgi:protein-S-isoprenylcysteine O-methyltransferase Ste14